MEGDILRCIAMMRDGNVEIAQQGTNAFSALLSADKMEVTRALFSVANASEDPAIRHYSSVLLVRTVKITKSELDPSQRAQVYPTWVQGSAALLRPGMVPFSTQKTLCELICDLVIALNSQEEGFRQVFMMARDLCGNEATVPTGIYMLSLIMSDLGPGDTEVPPEGAQLACSLVPQLLANGNSDIREVAYDMISAIAKSEEFVAQFVSLGDWFGEIGKMLLVIFNGFYEGNQDGNAIAAFARMITDLFEAECVGLLQYLQEMPQCIATKLRTDVEPMVLATSIGILEDFCKSMPEVVFPNVEAFVTELIGFSKVQYEGCPTDNLFSTPESCFGLIAELFVEHEEVEAGLSMFAKFINALQSDKTESSLVAAMVLIRSIFEPLEEHFVVAFDFVTSILDLAMNPESPLANPNTVEIAAGVIIIVAECLSLVPKLLAKFEPYLLRYLESNACLSALRSLYTQAEAAQEHLDINPRLGPLFTEVDKAASTGNITRLDALIETIGHLLFLADDELSDGVFETLVPRLRAVLQANGGQAPSAIYCFGALAIASPERVREILTDVVGAIVQAMDASGETTVSALDQFCNLFQIYEQTIKPVAYQVFNKAREVFGKVTPPEEFDDDNEDQSAALTYYSLKEHCLMVMGMILATYTDVGSGDDVGVLEEMTDSFLVECACFKDRATEPVFQLVLALTKRSAGDSAKEWYKRLIGLINETQTTDELRSAWERVTRVVWFTGSDLLPATAMEYFEALSVALQGKNSMYMTGKKRPVFNDKLVGKLMDATIAFFMVMGEAAGAETAATVITWLDQMYGAVQGHVSKASVLQAMCVVMAKFPALIPSKLEDVLKKLIEALQEPIGDCKQAALDGLGFLIEAAPEPVLTAVGEGLVSATKLILESDDENEIVKECALATLCAIYATSNQVTDETIQYTLQFLPVSNTALSLKFIARFVLAACQKCPDQMFDAALRLSVQVFSAPPILRNNIPDDQKSAMAMILRSASESAVSECADHSEACVMEVQRNLAGMA